MKVYNTLTRKKENLNLKKKIKLFICGLTPYDYAHIGHAKTYVQFDIIVKYLRYLKYDVFYLQNVTNIDDKIIERGNKSRKDPLKLSLEFEKHYKEDMKALGVNSISKYARATNYMKEIISQVERLVKKGYAYETDDGVYFSIEKFKDYGKLSKQPMSQIKEGARVNVNENKKHPSDFVIWKKEKPGEPSWNSKFGKGRPGWHIEDTAITEKEFGPQYDIHGGAVDLIFPHHEAEIAQMETISGKKPLVKYWFHTAFLNIEKTKMSKSLNNFITIRDALRKHDGKTIRYFFATQHYRTPINYSHNLLDQSKQSLDRLNDFIRYLKRSKDKDNPKLIEKTRKALVKAMDDDFNAPKAFSIIFNFVREVNKNGGSKESLKLMKEFDQIFNILTLKEDKLEKEIQQLINKREEARKEKDYKTADKIRAELNKKGIILEDTKEGVIWKYV
tara:strand:+ start:6773 stop:8110 length:1338 start_codon:yes stop_codon:yes gene_type:complete